MLDIERSVCVSAKIAARLDVLETPRKSGSGVGSNQHGMEGELPSSLPASSHRSLGLVTVGQRVQECDHVIDLSGSQRGSIAIAAIIRCLRGIHVLRKALWQIIEFPSVLFACPRIPFAGFRIAAHIKLDDFAQGVEPPVVEIRWSNGNVAQAGNSESTTEFSALREVFPKWPT